MTIARANCRALARTTEAIAAPSRKCRCQSSGRVMVSVSGIARRLFHVEGHGVERVAPLARDLGGERHGLLEGKLREERGEHGARIVRRALWFPPLDHEHEFTARAVAIGLDPRARFGKRHARDRLETLGELARDD